MPISTVTPPLTRPSTVPVIGAFSLVGLLDGVPDAMALRLLIAQQIAALGLLTLHHHVDHIAGMQLGLTGVVGHLLHGNQALGLEADIHDHMLVLQLHHGAR